MHIGEQLKLLDTTQKSKANSERASIIEQFLNELNAERVGTKYKPLSARAVAIKLGHIKDNFTLYYFLSTCRDSKKRNGSFGKCFFGSLKVR